jgi:hypothetical protein
MEASHMNIHNANTTRPRIQVAILAVVSVALLTTIATAHGGEEHVVGTVTKVTDTAVTVKTTAGKTVEVGFDAKTTYQRAKQPIQKSDIKVGDRIVIHATEVKEKLVAHTVEIGTAPQTKQAAKH